MRPRSLVALGGGCALIVIVNAIVLGSAAWNRRGEPPAQLTLTERELALPEFREADSSGLFVELRFAAQAPAAAQRVAWQRRYAMPRVDVPWLDAAKLRALGLRLDAPESVPTDEHDQPVAERRRAFVALELDGDGWAKLLAAREERVAAIRKEVEGGAAEPQAAADAEAVLNLDRAMRSRLVPIDAAVDAATLRARYADRPRTVVVESVIEAVYDDDGKGDAAWRGRISSLLVGAIRVPIELRPALEKFLSKETEAAAARREQSAGHVAWPTPVAPRYRATVAFGQRNEPWLVSVEPAD